MPSQETIDRNTRAVKDALKREGNRRCADCAARGPTVAAIAFRTFVCQPCANAHRESAGRHAAAAAPPPRRLTRPPLSPPPPCAAAARTGHISMADGNVQRAGAVRVGAALDERLNERPAIVRHTGLEA